MKIFELEIHRYRYPKFFNEITKYLSKKDIKKGKSIFTPNPEMCLATLQDAEFLHILQEADYLTSDGIGLYLGYQIQGNNYPKIVNIILFPYYFLNLFFGKFALYKKYGDRICGSDITEDLVYFCEATGISIAILDPFFPEDEAKCMAQKHFSKNLKKVFPNLKFDHYVYSEKNKNEIFNKIADSKAKVLFSTLGMKKQEVSVLEGLQKCKNLHLGLGVGSSFDYFVGFQKRAPEAWRSAGFEWLYRIFTSPNKLKRLRRIFQAVVVFPFTVIFYKSHDKSI
ncbi:WecB/TagA/CpsF family glycosyltransferase [Candidatus Gracilibacteria bacterium]|nr:WecB/TagA/CpsF family glycosyltransferase [Candidatus Gracilibacteria bacterium]